MCLMTNRTAAAKLAVSKWIRGQLTKWEDEAKAELCPCAESRRGEPYLMTKPDCDTGAVIQNLLYKGYTIDRVDRELPEGTTDANYADIALHG
jgi:hypothetical protein